MENAPFTLLCSKSKDELIPQASNTGKKNNLLQIFYILKNMEAMIMLFIFTV